MDGTASTVIGAVVLILVVLGAVRMSYRRRRERRERLVGTAFSVGILGVPAAELEAIRSEVDPVEKLMGYGHLFEPKYLEPDGWRLGDGGETWFGCTDCPWVPEGKVDRRLPGGGEPPPGMDRASVGEQRYWEEQVWTDSQRKRAWVLARFFLGRVPLQPEHLQVLKERREELEVIGCRLFGVEPSIGKKISIHWAVWKAMLFNR